MTDLARLKETRKALLERERLLESHYAETYADPDARAVARGLGEILDDVRGRLDEISNEIGHLESAEWEQRARENLESIARREPLSQR